MADFEPPGQFSSSQRRFRAIFRQIFALPDADSLLYRPARMLRSHEFMCFKLRTDSRDSSKRRNVAAGDAIMSSSFVRVVVRQLAGLVLGASPGALYAGLVAAVHFGVYGRWDRVPAFAVGCVLIGAVIGLLIAALIPVSEHSANRPVGDNAYTRGDLDRAGRGSKAA